MILVEKYNCDYKDHNELESLQLALQLQAEEADKAKKKARTNFAGLVQYLALQQEAMDPRLAAGEPEGGYTRQELDVTL